MLTSKSKIIILISIIAIASSGVILGVVIFQNTVKPSIRIGALSGDLHHLPLFVALENDYFVEEGLDINSENIIWFPNGNEVMVAFEASALDVSYLGMAPAMAHKLTQNAPIKIISGVNVNGSAIIVKAGSGINITIDLIDKKIGVPSLNNMQDFILQIALTEVGLSINNVTRVVLSVGNMETSLEGNQIDAFVAWEPFNAKATDMGAIYLNKSSNIWPNHPCCIIAASTGFLNSNSDKAQKIVQVHKRALEWMANTSNHDDLIVIAKKYTGIVSNSIIEIALNNVGYVYNYTLFQSEIERFYDDLTTLNSNIAAWSSGRANFFQELFDESYLNA
ncbi:MAG: ABC transporter substrate-binding protein [Candidatus Thorarchaeota archaeon]